MRISEFISNDFRITFYDRERLVEIEEFIHQDFKTRIVIPQKDFEKLIGLYNKWKKEV